MGAVREKTKLNVVYDSSKKANCDIWREYGSKVKVDDNIVTHVATQHNTIYGKLYTTGIVKWKINIIQSEKHAFIGVTDDKDYKNTYYWAKSANDVFYAIYQNPCKISAVGASWTNWGKKYKSDDSVTMELNLDKQTISYWVNDQFVGVAFDNIIIPQNGLRLATCLYQQGDCISIDKVWEFDPNAAPTSKIEDIGAMGDEFDESM